MKVPIELKRRYLNRKLQDIQCLRTLIDKDDYSEALRLGHQVKGNAVTFEFPQMAIVGLEIENAAKRQDKEKVKLLLLKMETMIQMTQI